MCSQTFPGLILKEVAATTELAGEVFVQWRIVPVTKGKGAGAALEFGCCPILSCARFFA